MMIRFIKLSINPKEGRFENISFPNKPGLIDIYGVGIKVLHAGNQKLDYILMPE
jgi:hypothetical protein